MANRQILEFQPAPAPLNRWVIGFVRRVDRSAGDVVAELPELRSAITVMTADDDWLKEADDASPWAPAPRTGLWGPRHSIGYGFAKSHIEAYAVGLTVAGLRALTGRPPADFVNQVVPLANLSDALASDLSAAASGDLGCWAASAGERLAMFFRNAPPAPAIASAIDFIMDNSGAPVANLAASLGLSERHFRRLFRAEFGAAPKTIQRLARFDRALREVHPAPWEKGERADGDYADQAHMIREFSKIAGLTPAHYVRIKKARADAVLRAVPVDMDPPPAFAGSADRR